MIGSAAVIGCGSIGRRHLLNLRTLGVGTLLAVDDAADRGRAAAQDAGAMFTPSVDEALARAPQAVIVAVPPYLHVSIARAAIAAGADVFIEKPISHTLDAVDALIEEIDATGRVAAVGYNLRFHAGLARLRALVDDGAVDTPLMFCAEFGQYLPDWRPAEDYRTGYNAQKAAGGGIILDASHELDYVTWMGGRATSVFCTAGHLSRLEIDVEDAAAITARLSGGAIAEIHLDSIQRRYARTCKVIGEGGTLLWDYESGISWFRPGDSRPEQFAIAPEPNEMYLAEMRHFLACVRRDERPLVDARVGADVLRIALAARRSMESGCTVVVA